MEKTLQKSYDRLQFFDGARFMAGLLSNRVNLFAEGIHKT